MTAEPVSSASENRAPVRRIVTGQPQPSAAAKASAAQEVLIIASRLKEYIQARAEMNTSAAVVDVLSDHVRRICDQAIEHARQEGRKTVLDRDLEFLRNLRF